MHFGCLAMIIFSKIPFFIYFFNFNIYIYFFLYKMEILFQFNLSVYMCEAPSQRLESRPLPSTPHKHLYSQNNHRTKEVRWLKFHQLGFCFFNFSHLSLWRLKVVGMVVKVSILCSCLLCFNGIMDELGLCTTIMLNNLVWILLFVLVIKNICIGILWEFLVHALKN